MEPPSTEGPACWACRKPADPPDNFCRHCGKGLRGFPWYYQHWGIILLTFLALGPFSLTLVWRSPVLSTRARWIYTAALILLTWWTVVQCYQAWLMLKSTLDMMKNGTIGIPTIP